jgi:hypothetical protein
MKKNKRKIQYNRLLLPVIMFGITILTGLFINQQYSAYTRSIKLDGLSAPVNGAKNISTGWKRFRLFYEREFNETERKNIRVTVPFEHKVRYISDYEIYSTIYKKERPLLNIETDPVLREFFSGYSRKKVLTIERTGKLLEKDTLYTVRVTSTDFNIFNYIFGPKEYIYKFGTGSNEEDENISRTAKLMSSLGSFAATYQSKESREKQYEYYKKCVLDALDYGYNFDTKSFDKDGISFQGENFRAIDYSCDEGRVPAEEITVDIKSNPIRGKAEFNQFLEKHNVDKTNVRIIYAE